MNTIGCADEGLWISSLEDSKKRRYSVNWDQKKWKTEEHELMIDSGCFGHVLPTEVCTAISNGEFYKRWGSGSKTTWHCNGKSRGVLVEPVLCSCTVGHITAGDSRHDIDIHLIHRRLGPPDQRENNSHPCAAPVLCRLPHLQVESSLNLLEEVKTPNKSNQNQNPIIKNGETC